MSSGEPYFAIGPLSRGFRDNLWIEFPVVEPNHSALVMVADRLIREHGAVVTERWPDAADDVNKEYWYLPIGPTQLLVMRKDGVDSIGLCLATSDDDRSLLIHLGHA